MELRSEQDPVSVDYMINLLKHNGTNVYMEIGCAQLGTFDKFRKSLPADGLALGLDARAYKNWSAYKEYVNKDKDFCSNIFISDQGLDHKKAIDDIKEVLDGRKIDFLFIDGNHNVEPTRSDYLDFSSFVRSGGIIAFHDLDWGAFARGDTVGQGAAVVLSELKQQGYIVENVPGIIGIGLIRKR